MTVTSPGEDPQQLECTRDRNILSNSEKNPKQLECTRDRNILWGMPSPGEAQKRLIDKALFKHLCYLSVPIPPKIIPI